MTLTLRNFHERLEQALASALASVQTMDQEIQSDPNLSQETAQLQESIGRALWCNEKILKVLNEYLEAQD